MTVFVKQRCSNEPWREVSNETVIAVGINITPVKRSACAMLDNRMFESLCSSLLFLKAMITDAFKIIDKSEEIDEIATKTQKAEISLVLMSGSCWQSNIPINIVLVVESVIASVPF